MRDFFIKTGNNNNVKIAPTNFCYKNLLSVDDGLSNWRDINFKFTLRFIPHFHFNKEKSRKLAYINKYFLEANNQKIVRHYSIFSKMKI